MKFLSVCFIILLIIFPLKAFGEVEFYLSGKKVTAAEILDQYEWAKSCYEKKERLKDEHKDIKPGTYETTEEFEERKKLLEKENAALVKKLNCEKYEGRDCKIIIKNESSVSYDRKNNELYISVPRNLIPKEKGSQLYYSFEAEISGIIIRRSSPRIRLWVCLWHTSYFNKDYFGPDPYFRTRTQTCLRRKHEYKYPYLADEFSKLHIFDVPVKIAGKIKQKEEHLTWIVKGRLHFKHAGPNAANPYVFYSPSLLGEDCSEQNCCGNAVLSLIDSSSQQTLLRWTTESAGRSKYY